MSDCKDNKQSQLGDDPKISIREHAPVPYPPVLPNSRPILPTQRVRQPSLIFYVLHKTNYCEVCLL